MSRDEGRERGEGISAGGCDVSGIRNVYGFMVSRSEFGRQCKSNGILFDGTIIPLQSGDQKGEKEITDTKAKQTFQHRFNYDRPTCFTVTRKKVYHGRYVV